MAEDFKSSGHEGAIPFDWTLYYLRKKALTQRISPEELSICYNIENTERDHLKQQDYVPVISSDQILTMCGKCGNKHNAEATEKALKTVFNQKRGLLN